MPLLARDELLELQIVQRLVQLGIVCAVHPLHRQSEQAAIHLARFPGVVLDAALESIALLLFPVRADVEDSTANASGTISNA